VRGKGEWGVGGFFYCFTGASGVSTEILGSFAEILGTFAEMLGSFALFSRKKSYAHYRCCVCCFVKSLHMCVCVCVVFVSDCMCVCV